MEQILNTAPDPLFEHVKIRSPVRNEAIPQFACAGIADHHALGVFNPSHNTEPVGNYGGVTIRTIQILDLLYGTSRCFRGKLGNSVPLAAYVVCIRSVVAHTPQQCRNGYPLRPHARQHGYAPCDLGFDAHPATIEYQIDQVRRSDDRGGHAGREHHREGSGRDEIGQ